VPQPNELPPVADQPGLRRVRRVGTGFLRIDRSVFEAMIDGGQAGAFALDGKHVRHFFPSGLLDGEFLSEDYYFCELAACAGFGNVDSRIRLQHVGRLVYRHD